MNETSVDNKKVHGSARDTWQRLWRPLVLLAVLIAVALLSKIFGWGERLGDLRYWILSLGAWGPPAFVLIYILATVAALPGFVLSLVAGAIFGSVLGVIVVSIGATLGAGLAFLIARYFARDAVVRWLSENEKFNRLDEMTAKYGAVIVAIVRLIPLFPFDIVNYGFGLTRVSFLTYFIWSGLCMLPTTILYVAGADAFTQGITGETVPWPLVGILAATSIILVLLIRYAHSLLKKKEESGGN